MRSRTRGSARSNPPSPTWPVTGRCSPDRSRLYLAVVVAAELGDGAGAAFEALESALRKEPGDADLRQSAACVFALASKAVGRNDAQKGRAVAGRALALLETAVRENDLNFALLDDSFYFDPIREAPAFGKLLDAGHPERRFCGVWTTEARFEAATLDGLDSAEHLRRGRELASRGYRPVAWSVGRTSADGLPLSASVWHRPVVATEVKDRLAQRQARGAVALVRLGKAESVWPLLRHALTQASAATSSTGSTRWEPTRVRPRRNSTGSTPVPVLLPPPGSRRWTRCSSIPRPPSGGP